jgi:hypothetical protein
MRIQKFAFLISILFLGKTSASTLEGQFFPYIQQGNPNTNFGADFGVAWRALEWGEELSLDLGLNIRALEGKVGRSLSVGPLGFAQADLLAQLAFPSMEHPLGGRLKATFSGTLATVALTGELSAWNAAQMHPLDAYALEPESLAATGLKAALSGKYRLSRNQIITASLDASSTSFATASYTSISKETDWRLGAWLGQTQLGLAPALVGGITQRFSEDVTAQADALLALNDQGVQYGIKASGSVFGVLPLESDLKFYAAFEPWRSSAQALRLGLETHTPLEWGEVYLASSAGSGFFSLGLKVVYNLDQPSSSDAEGAGYSGSSEPPSS